MHASPTETANRKALRACLVMGVVFAAVTAFVYLHLLRWAPPFPRDPSGLVVGRDFLNFWMYGKAAFMPQPGRWYDPVLYQQMLSGLLGPGYPGLNWSYPPTLMLLAAPFGHLPYLAALLLWTVLGLVLFVLSLRRAVPLPVIIAAAVSPAALFCLISGQCEFVIAALLLTAFVQMDRRPVLAGLLIGLVSLKPHMGLLLPVALAASGRWRVFGWATVTTAALALAALLLFGVESWTRFLTLGLAAQNQVLADPQGIATPFYPTIFMNLHGAGLPYTVAMGVQAGCALAATLVVGWAFRVHRAADPRLLFALLMAANATALPYLLIYGLLPLCVAALWLLDEGRLDLRERILTRLVYWLPLLQIGLGRWHIPGAAAIPALFLSVLALRLMRQVPPSFLADNGLSAAAPPT